MIRFLAVMAGVPAAVAVFGPPPASAAPAAAAMSRPGSGQDSGTDGGNSGGNGRRNNNAFSVGSPTLNRGYQHTSSGNAGGANSVQNALCRNATVCNVTQNVTIVQVVPGQQTPAQGTEPSAPVSYISSLPQVSGPPGQIAAPASGGMRLLSLGPYTLMLVPAGSAAPDEASATRFAGPPVRSGTGPSPRRPARPSAPRLTGPPASGAAGPAGAGVEIRRRQVRPAGGAPRRHESRRRR